MVTDVKPLQSSKAYLPMDVTLSGMFTDVKLVHEEKAPSSMPTTEYSIPSEIIDCGIMTSPV